MEMAMSNRPPILLSWRLVLVTLAAPSWTLIQLFLLWLMAKDKFRLLVSTLNVNWNARENAVFSSGNCASTKRMAWSANLIFESNSHMLHGCFPHIKYMVFFKLILLHYLYTVAQNKFYNHRLNKLWLNKHTAMRYLTQRFYWACLHFGVDFKV